MLATLRGPADYRASTHDGRRAAFSSRQSRLQDPSAIVPKRLPEAPLGPRLGQSLLRCGRRRRPRPALPLPHVWRRRHAAAAGLLATPSNAGRRDRGRALGAAFDTAVAATERTSARRALAPSSRRLRRVRVARRRSAVIPHAPSPCGCPISRLTIRVHGSVSGVPTEGCRRSRYRHEGRRRFRFKPT